jgi:hypothetical protein
LARKTAAAQQIGQSHGLHLVLDVFGRLQVNPQTDEIWLFLLFFNALEVMTRCGGTIKKKPQGLINHVYG